MRFDDAKRGPVRLGALLALAITIGGCAGGSTPGTDAGTAGSPLIVSTSGPTSAAGSQATSGGRSVQRTATGAILACDLLISAQIEAAIGTAVVEAANYGDIECRWKLQPLASIKGSQDPWIDAQFFENDLPMRTVEAAPGTNGVVAIQGLGDRAFRTNQSRHLWVQHGNDVFVVRSRLAAISDESEATRMAAEAIELKLARLVLDQL